MKIRTWLPSMVVLSVAAFFADNISAAEAAGKESRTGLSGYCIFGNDAGYGLSAVSPDTLDVHEQDTSFFKGKALQKAPDMSGKDKSENTRSVRTGESYMPAIHGTIRGKYEYQTNEAEGRFSVRNARVSFLGNVLPYVGYKAEIDLSDEGSIKMLDAYVNVQPWRNLELSVGQMRVPFTIDAHRSPHRQYFANRSFIAKEVGNVRDVGMMAEYKFGKAVPIILEAGLFNGRTILTDQKSSWRKGISYSAKAQIFFIDGLNLTLSMQGMKPTTVNQTAYDAGIYYRTGRLHAEAEYLYKHYADNAYDDVQALDVFISYGIPVKRIFKCISFLARYDYMTNHSDGKSFVLDSNGNPTPFLATTDLERQRLTGGITFSLGKEFQADIRLNFEKYFYGDHLDFADPSERDKVVLELMVHF